MVLAGLHTALGQVLLRSEHLPDPEARGDPVISHCAVVHQAAGTVTVQAGTTLADAMARLQAHALGRRLSLTEVSRHVVARDLRFDARDDHTG